MSTREEQSGNGRGTSYAELRESYDRAFRQWTEERRRRDEVTGSGSSNQALEVEENARCTEAYLAVQRWRDSLATFLISPHPANLSYSQIQHAAYFLWLDAGCPSGTAASDWLNAEKKLSAV